MSESIKNKTPRKSITELNEEYDPKCPGCHGVHPRMRTKNSGSSFIVAEDEDRLIPNSCGEPGPVRNQKGDNVSCKWHGALSPVDFEKGLKRSTQVPYRRGNIIWYEENRGS